MFYNLFNCYFRILILHRQKLFDMIFALPTCRMHISTTPAAVPAKKQRAHIIRLHIQNPPFR